MNYWLLLLFFVNYPHHMMKHFDESKFHKELKIISIEKANRAGLLLILPVVFVFNGLFALIHGWIFSGYFSASLTWTNFFIDLGSAALIIILGIMLHELIHGVTWSLFTKRGFKSIKFGVLWKYLTPYCHCKEPLKMKHYLLGAIAPAIILGFIPAIWGLIAGSVQMMSFGQIFILAAIGDFMIIKLLAGEPMDIYVQDHSSEPGCYIYREIEQ